VRFRELVQRLYDEGFRAFIQVGGGGLAGFVGDTLKERDHIAQSAQAGTRGGLEQLWRLAAAIWTDGGTFDLSRLAPKEQKRQPKRPIKLKLGLPLVTLPQDLALSAPARPGPARSDGPSHPILTALDAVAADVLAAQDEVARAALTHTPAPRAKGLPAPRALTIERNLGVNSVPALWDHCLLPQPAGWNNAADGQPVVPMTMHLALIAEAAVLAAPGRVVVKITDVRAAKWLVVEPALTVQIRVTPLADHQVRVVVDDYVEAVAHLATQFPPPPKPRGLVLTATRPGRRGEEIYRDRWMFHGPQYQGIVHAGPLGQEGIKGELVTPAGPGALLDNAGQLFGYWVMDSFEQNRLAMPLSLGGVSFFGPHPEVGARLSCDVSIRATSSARVSCDLELYRGDAVWCRIDGWEDIRFETDAIGWEVIQRPEKNLLSLVRRAGYVWFDSGVVKLPSRDWLRRRYLGQAERDAMQALPPRQTRQWLNARVAAKDAARAFWWSHGRPTLTPEPPLFPVELSVVQDETHTQVAGPPGRLRVATAAQGDVAVAMVDTGDVGLALHRIDAAAPTLRPAERVLAGSDPEALWLARCHAAKAAIATLVPEVAVPQSVDGRDGERLYLGRFVVDTALEAGDIVVALARPVRA
jgi:hypothetical protein